MSESRASSRSNGRSSNGSGRSSTPSPAALARRACAEFAELLGRDPEGIVSMERTEDGWQIGIEVVEIRRIPDTADVLAEYEVSTDRRGRLQGYRRGRRYSRGSVQDAP